MCICITNIHKTRDNKKINNIDKIENLDYVTQFLLLVKEGDTIELYEDERQDCGRVYGIANNIFDANIKRNVFMK